MKILCVAISREYFLTSSTAYTKAMTKEHEVYTCYPQKEPSGIPGVRGHLPCNWNEFDFTLIHMLEPDVIVTGNPRASWNRAPMLFLRMAGFPMVFAEYGWLPQREHFYLDPIGLGNESILNWIQMFDDQNFFEMIFELDDSLEQLQALQTGYYKPRKKVTTVPEGDFLFVPLQWEWDSSILFDSNYFKSMDHLISFVASNFPELPVVVKTHPLDKNRARNCKLPNIVYAPNDTDPIALIQQSRAIFGINSTLLIEALVAEKPIAALGKNVASGRDVYYEGYDLYRNPRGLLDFQPQKEQIALALRLLLEWQISFKEPDMRKINRALTLSVKLNKWKDINGYYSI